MWISRTAYVALALVDAATGAPIPANRLEARPRAGQPTGSANSKLDKPWGARSLRKENATLRQGHHRRGAAKAAGISRQERQKPPCWGGFWLRLGVAS